MSKYITLIKDEFSNTFLALLLSLGILYFTSMRSYELSLMQDFLNFGFINAGGAYQYLSLFDTNSIAYSFIWISILVFAQYRFAGNPIWYSLPYTKTQIYITKIIYGIIAVTILHIFLTIGVLSIYQKYSFIYTDTFAISSVVPMDTNISAILQIMLLAYCTSLTFYCALSAMQYLVKNAILGSALGLALLLAPTTLIKMICLVIKGGEFWDYSHPIIGLFDIYSTPNSYLYYDYATPDLQDTYTMIPYLSSYTSSLSKALVLFAASVVFVMLGYFVSKSSKQSVNTSIFTFKFSRILTIFLAVVLALSITPNYWNNDFSQAKYALIQIIVAVITAIIAIIVINIFDRGMVFRKRGVKNEN